MKNPEIKSSNRTFWANQNESVTQPSGVDYDKLISSMNSNVKKVDDKRKKVESSIRDLRKQSYKDSDLSKEDNSSLERIDHKSIIPIPGLLIDSEDSGSDTRPPDSDWIAPHGPQWGPMTQ
ncbi:hypothetical protein D3C81_500700 [compost metagenome]